MEADMSIDQVLTEIKKIQESGEPLSKKKVKTAYPQLMRNALFYFPSWEHALQNSDTMQSDFIH